MSGLPHGWIQAKLGDVCQVVRGITFPASAKEVSLSDTNVCCLRTSNVQAEIDWNDVYFVPREYVKRTDQLVQPGDILMSMANSRELVGKVAVVREIPFPTGFGAFLSAIRARDTINRQYLFHLLRSSSVQDALRRGSSQTVNIANISIKALADIDIPLPPLAEQQRIADKLDVLLGRVDACRARLERVPAVLKRFRQAVLAAATSGRLTVEWREENPAGATTTEVTILLQEKYGVDLFDHSNEDTIAFGGGDLPSEWLTIPIRAVGEVYLGRQRSPENHVGPNMRPYMRAANITWRGWDLSDVKEMNFDARDFARYQLRDGDVLLGEGSGSADEVGKPAIWRGAIPGCCFQNTLICVRPHFANSEYLYYVFLHAALSKMFVAGARGVNIHHIGKDRFSAFLIPFPSLAEQHEIVRRVEALFAHADRLEARYAAAREQVEQLAPSLLAKAFRGELVKQE